MLLKNADPSNLASPLVAKVADFGLARDFGVQTRIQTRKYGTITHMPPELLTDGELSKVSSPRHYLQPNPIISSQNPDSSAHCRNAPTMAT